ncbi:Hydroxyacid-oxoacid transhydrogenase, mitochondrial [Geranomyces variabilis]|nr:Hydroxyacid-oxoacid transhydrogenase, mitochondrial [Geranomyces variabilis]
MPSTEMKQVVPENDQHQTISVPLSTNADGAGHPPRPTRGESLHPPPPDSVAINMPADSDLRRRNNASGGDAGSEEKPGTTGKSGTEIYWEDVRFKVSTGSGKDKKEREILKGDSGRAEPGQLIAVMGGSGAGKTTLLNLLAGRIPQGEPSGLVLADGKVRDKRRWKKLIGYVEQEDLLYENLTVRETLMTSALLRLPSAKYSQAQKVERVEEVMRQLGISHVADSRIGSGATGGISGGEKKRVSIGIELVADPMTLFLDEPTTGLDSATSLSVINILKDLAVETNRVIILTIHMPRETILGKLDKVALMSKGQMVWFGPSDKALEHFARLGHKCPPQTNPADFYLDLIQDTEKDKDSKTVAENLIDEWSAVEKDYTTPIDEETRQQALKTQDSKKSKKGRQEVAGAWEDEEGRWATSWFSEFSVLLKRNFKQTFRNKTIVISGFMQQFTILLLLGFVFFRLAADSAGVQSRQGILFFVCINQTFSFLMPIITVFPLERRIILRERASGSYRTSAAYLAKAISLWPLACLSSLLFSVCVYWLVGLQPTFVKWLLFQVITQSLVFAAQALGMLIGSSVPNVQMAQIVGPLIVVTFVIFGGNFTAGNSITVVLRWIQWISLIRYTYGAYMQNEFNGLQLNCGGATGGVRCTPNGSEVLSLQGLDSPSLGICILILLALGVTFHFLAAMVLRKTTRMRIVHHLIASRTFTYIHLHLNMAAASRTAVWSLMSAVTAAGARCPCHAPAVSKVLKRHAPGCENHDHSHNHTHHKHSSKAFSTQKEDADYAFEMATSTIRYGKGVTREVGMDLKNMKMKKVAVFTDVNVAQLYPMKTMIKSLEDAGVHYVVYDRVRVEPNDISFQDAIAFVRKERPDAFVAVGGGSVIDTAKAANLYLCHPEEEFLAFVNSPIGKGKPVYNAVKPLIAVPTTAGTGSETTGVSIFDYTPKNFKTGIAHRSLKPFLGIVDPLNTRTMPPQVHVASGLDVLCHSLESYTAIPYNERTPRPKNPIERPAYQGSNPISDMWSIKALKMCIDNLPRAYKSPDDHKAQEQMILASTFAGIGFGNAGVHLCHGLSYPIAGGVKNYQHPGYKVDHKIVPHGISVAVSAPAVFKWTAPACADRHLEAAALFGADISNAKQADAGPILSDAIRKFLHVLDVPNGISALGYTKDDTNMIVEGTLPQHRVTKMSPRPVDYEALERLVEDSYTIY